MIHWLAAFRLKTLPLALGAIILGSVLNVERFRIDVFLLAASTAIILQILSNLANDYGDFVKGTDRHRTDRQLAGGHITPRAMLIAIVIMVLMALFSGIGLLNLAFGDNWKYWSYFLAIGIGSIVAAITYTMGKKAYGYNGLGDLFVFVFFGLVGVLGTAFLYDQSITIIHLLPSVAYGSLCMGVLNVNNIRDIDKDILTDKITLAAKLGEEGAVRYQGALIVVAFAGMLGHHIWTNYWSVAPLGVLILAVIHLKKLKGARSMDDYNAQLKLLSLGSLGVVLLFAVKLFP